MRKRIGKPSIPRVVIAAVLVIAFAVGLIVGGGTGDTIVFVAAAVLAIILLGTFGTFGTFRPSRTRRYPPGDEREREPTEHGPDRYPNGPSNYM
jgi:hypothetical protein